VGVLFRGDAGFGGSEHAKGNAADLGEMNFQSVDDVVALLEDLPSHKLGAVFPDFKNHVHLQIVGDKYGFGFPWEESKGFFKFLDMLYPKRGAAKKTADKSKPLVIRGLMWGWSSFGKTIGKWDETKWDADNKVQGMWVWTDPVPDGDSALPMLQSDKLKDALSKLGATPAPVKANAHSEDSSEQEEQPS
jgi:hypothetical protein